MYQRPGAWGVSYALERKLRHQEADPGWRNQGTILHLPDSNVSLVSLLWVSAVSIWAGFLVYTLWHWDSWVSREGGTCVEGEQWSLKSTQCSGGHHRGSGAGPQSPSPPHWALLTLGSSTSCL